MGFATRGAGGIRSESSRRRLRGRAGGPQRPKGRGALEGFLDRAAPAGVDFAHTQVAKDGV